MKKILLTISAPVFLVSATSQNAPDRFDLVCWGTTKDKDSEVLPTNRILHVDLARGLYCWKGKCQQVSKIKSQSHEMIVFSDPPSDGYWIKGLSWWKPETGEYGEETIATTRAFTHNVTQAACLTSAFSGPAEVFLKGSAE